MIDFVINREIAHLHCVRRTLALAGSTVLAHGVTVLRTCQGVSSVFVFAVLRSDLLATLAPAASASVTGLWHTKTVAGATV